MTTPTTPLDCDGFADALADYLDGDVSDAVGSAVESHASWCAACQQLLADLRDLRIDAAALPPLTPSRDLWQGISERIDARVIPLDVPRAVDIPRRRRWLGPAIAAAALVVITAGVTRYATRASIMPSAVLVASSAITPPARTAVPSAQLRATAPERAASAPRARLASTAPLMHETEPLFASEIGTLRQIVRARRAVLDPKTVAVLEQSIAVMDSAIAQSRAALIKDPASGFLASQLNHSLEKKVELLRTAAQLPSRI